MKRIYLIVLTVLCSQFIFAQEKSKDEKEKPKFAEHLFFGGSLNLSLSSNQFTVGVAPVLGYAFNRWADAGILLNFNYTSFRDYQYSGDKLHQTIYGPGAFVRLFPLPFLFAQAQYEHNFIKLKYYPPSSGPTQKISLDANSLLVGAGYTSGRTNPYTAFYYLTVMFDVSKADGSPYVDYYNRALPIINAGIVFPLTRSGRNKRDRDEDF